MTASIQENKSKLCLSFWAASQLYLLRFPIHSLWTLELDFPLYFSKIGLGHVGLLDTDPLIFPDASLSLSLSLPLPLCTSFLFHAIFIFFMSYSPLPCHILLALVISKLDLCEGGSFSTAIFNSDIQLSVLILFVFYIIYVCPFVAYKGNVCRKWHIVLYSWY